MILPHRASDDGGNDRRGCRPGSAVSPQGDRSRPTSQQHRPPARSLFATASSYPTPGRAGPYAAGPYDHEGDTVRALPDFRLEAYFSKWEFTARYHLTASDAQSMRLTDLLALADDDGRKRWETLELAYTETRGLPALREEIAGTYDNLEAEDVVCFAGGAEQILLAMRTLLDADSHAVV